MVTSTPSMRRRLPRHRANSRRLTWSLLDGARIGAKTAAIIGQRGTVCRRAGEVEMRIRGWVCHWIAAMGVLSGCHAPAATGARAAVDRATSAPATVPIAKPGYLSLGDGSLHVDDGRPINGLFVRGTLRDGRLLPVGDIEGEGPLGEAGQPGWMELADGSFHGDQTARPPFKPYVRGYRTADGEFRPSSRTVVY